MKNTAGDRLVYVIWEHFKEEGELGEISIGKEKIFPVWRQRRMDVVSLSLGGNGDGTCM